ncbi:GFA family protein [Sphingomonas canadensis]|uniref:GFA family protein n=1 Tax=Sphingomonas canadensis TaxID=1219257 RepID=A0ABW3H6A0_9SPHN|nr:aldehyde-activating protein [Sphingomonas canadensis]MCW3835276.1 aldehyde-activating protein [Sphingomonas canadensis]
MIALSCNCGAIRIETRKKPDFINACNCALCRKSGAFWGYFHPSEVTVTGAGSSFRRKDKADPAVDVHFCAACGSTTHFRLTGSALAKFGDTMMGVNMWLADEADLAGVELRFPDGRNWDGAGEFGHVRPAEVIGAVGAE